MEEEILVSICCITYNQEKYIAKTIDSFISQKTNFKCEILIHDDASTDKTQEIIKKYEERYPELITGIYQTENQYSKGIMTSQIVRSRAKGKYIAFCEGDDFWCDNNKLQKQVDFLEKNPEFIATAHWCKVIDENDEVTDAFINSDEVFNFKKEIYDLEDYKNKYIPGHVNTIVHKNIFKDGRYNEIYKASKKVGDRTTYLILVLLGKIYVHHEVMSAYRYITNNGISYSSKVEGKNQNYDWYIYNKNLENLVEQQMGVKVDLKNFKYHHLLQAMKTYRKTKSEEDKKIYKDIWKDASKIQFMKYCLKRIGEKLKNE